MNRRAFLLAVLATSAARAQEPPDPRLAAASYQVALAHVLTGDAVVDATTAAGLRGLSDALAARTTVEPGPPVAVDLEADDLTLLTFLYWPVTDSQPLPSPAAYARLNAFLRGGGLVLLDTRDGDLAGTGASDASSLRALAAPLDIPPLAPLPADHVLTRSFYLLDGAPGRWTEGQVWVEAPTSADAAPEGGFRTLNDNVSPVVIGGNAWAEAWAVDDAGLPLHMVGQGWDGERQRELALRFGINLAMYVLTGNYKSDQVHVPELLDRLSREEIR